MDSRDKGLEFLNNLYKDLYKSEEVMHRVEKKYIGNKIENIDNYLKRLENIHIHASEKERYKELLKELYYRKYVIKEENIKGYNKDEIINNQKRSLSKWIDYLSDSNTNYPTWQKYWMFQGMLKIGTYDEANDTYMKRNNKTTAPFIDINPEVLAKCIELLNSYLDNKELAEKDFEKIVQSGNFAKLYTVLLSRNKKERNNLTSKDDGIWIKYNGNSYDYIKLSESLDGKGTGWCTVSEKTAKDQLNGGSGYYGGDFYVYYTKDENNKYENPRIAIRMDGIDEIGEIRGIEDSQNIEEGFEEIVEKKLKELKVKNIEGELKKVNNCRNLTRLNRKMAKKDHLTKEDIKFIFSSIESFGWENDPRVEKIQDEILSNFYDLEYLFDNLSNNEIIELIKINPSLLYKMRENQQTPEICLEAVKKDGRSLYYVKKQTPEICLAAVKQNGDVLKYVKERTPKICLAAVKQSGRALYYVKEKTFEICLEAVKKYGGALEYVEEQTPEICLEAVKEYGGALIFVKEQTPKICLAAVEQNGWALRYVKEQTPEICMAAVKQDGAVLQFVKEQTPEICLAAVEKYGAALVYVKEQTLEICIEAFKYDWRLLKKVKEQTPEICSAAVKQYGAALVYVKEQTPEICMAAVTQEGYALSFVKEQTPEICLAAVKQSGGALVYVKEQTPEICLEAVKQEGLALSFVKEQTLEICLAAVKQDGEALEYVEKQNSEICLEAVKQNEEALRFVLPEYRQMCENYLAALLAEEDDNKRRH